MYTNGWFILRFVRKQQNSVKQLSFNKKNKLEKEHTHTKYLLWKLERTLKVIGHQNFPVLFATFLKVIIGLPSVQVNSLLPHPTQEFITSRESKVLPYTKMKADMWQLPLNSSNFFFWGVYRSKSNIFLLTSLFQIKHYNFFTCSSYKMALNSFIILTAFIWADS